MAARNRGPIAVALVLLVIGGYELYNYNPIHTFQSTFNVLPSKFMKILANLRDSTRITGTFQETAGRPVSFMIMSSVQFAAFQTNANNTANLFSIADTATGNVDWTSTIPDSYYLIFRHGAGLLAATQTVNFQRTYTSVDIPAIVAGAALVVLAAIELYWGFRPAGKRAELPSSVAADIPPPPWP
jgi:hypothetical protein